MQNTADYVPLCKNFSPYSSRTTAGALFHAFWNWFALRETEVTRVRKYPGAMVITFTPKRRISSLNSRTAFFLRHVERRHSHPVISESQHFNERFQLLRILPLSDPQVKKLILEPHHGRGRNQAIGRNGHRNGSVIHGRDGEGRGRRSLSSRLTQ